MVRPKRLGRDLIDKFHEAGASILVGEFCFNLNFRPELPIQ